MQNRKKIVGISGSTRQNSSNLNVLKAIAALFNDRIEMSFFEGIGALPQFNPDDTDADIPLVAQFRKQISDAHGVIICTPEYAHGVPGALKNAIDWTVTTNEFSQKPTALITASSDGRFGHAALLETLRTIEAKNVSQQQLIIPFIKTKMGLDNTITDVTTLSAIKELVQQLLLTIEDAAPTV
jgi:chromate reductase